MAKFFDALDEHHLATIAASPVFFVATAAADARINLSPKGYECFRVLSPNRVAYLDLGESVQTSCGWGVPLMEFASERQSLLKAHAQADPGLWSGKARNRRESIDGLPVRTTDRYIRGEWTHGPSAPSQPSTD